MNRISHAWCKLQMSSIVNQICQKRFQAFSDDIPSNMYIFKIITFSRDFGRSQSILKCVLAMQKGITTDIICDKWDFLRLSAKQVHAVKPIFFSSKVLVINGSWIRKLLKRFCTEGFLVQNFCKVLLFVIRQ